MQCNIHSFYDSTVVELDNKAFHIMTNKNGYAYVYHDADPKINAETIDKCIYRLIEDGVVTAFRFKDTQFNIIRCSGSSYIVIIIRDGTIYDSRITKPTLYECIEVIIEEYTND